MPKENKIEKALQVIEGQFKSTIPIDELWQKHFKNIEGMLSADMDIENHPEILEEILSLDISEISPVEEGSGGYQQRLLTTPWGDFKLGPGAIKLAFEKMKPESFSLTVTELCKRAKISRTRYYQLAANPEFSRLMAQISKSNLSVNVGMILNVIQYEAIVNRNDKFMQMLLTVLGLMKAKGGVTVNVFNQADGNKSEISSEISAIDDFIQTLEENRQTETDTSIEQK